LARAYLRATHAFFSLLMPPPPPSTPFPYTTLFRSVQRLAQHAVQVGGAHARRRLLVQVLRQVQHRPHVLAVLRRDERQRHVIQRSEEHTSELQSRFDLVCRLLLEKKNSRQGGLVRP